MVVKKTALESIMRSIVGAPVRVTTGYIRKAKATIPWNEILTKPVEIVVSDLHVVCDSPAAFDKEFAERALHKAKRKQFDELLRQFKVSHPALISIFVVGTMRAAREGAG